MRLVDADALIAKQANIAKKFARSDAQKSLMGRIMFNTESAPTIDAIPVEWLRTFDLYYNGISGGTPFMNALVEAWKREQGAQDEPEV